MEGGVLPDVEGCEVEAEGIEDPADRGDVVVGEAGGSGVAEGAVEGEEVEVEILGTPVAAGSIPYLGELTGVDLDREASGEEFGGLAPGFARVHLEDGCGVFAEGVGGAVPQFEEGGWGGLDPVGEREALGEEGELSMEDDEGVGAETFEGLAGDISRDAGMAIAVTTDPGAEAEAREAVVAGKEGGIEAGAGPGVAEASVELGDDGGEDVAEVVQDVAALVGDRGFLEEDLAGAPEPLQEGRELVAGGLAIRGRGGVLEEMHEGAMLFEDGGALGLGGVGGEDRFHLDLAERGGDGIRRGAGFAQGTELFGPEALLDLGSLGGFAEVPHGFGGVFLDGIEELEGHGEAEAEAWGWLEGGVGQGAGRLPGDPSGQFRFAQAGEDLGQATCEPLDLALDLLESDGDIVGWRGGSVVHGIHGCDRWRCVSAVGLRRCWWRARVPVPSAGADVNGGSERELGLRVCGLLANGGWRGGVFPTTHGTWQWVEEPRVRG